MVDNNTFLSALSDRFTVGDINEFIINLILAVLLLIVGFLLGKFIRFVLKRGLEKANIERTIRESFIELFITVIQWSIYILFIYFALKVLNIPQLTAWLTPILVVIPALVGALLLIGVGFAIAVYLRVVIEDSEILGWKVLSQVFFYFVLYVFIIFALKTVFVSQDVIFVNNIILILTAAVAVGLTYFYVKSKR